MPFERLFYVFQFYLGRPSGDCASFSLLCALLCVVAVMLNPAFTKEYSPAKLHIKSAFCIKKICQDNVAVTFWG